MLFLLLLKIAPLLTLMPLTGHKAITNRLSQALVA
jgi:hypothetical protein